MYQPYAKLKSMKDRNRRMKEALEESGVSDMMGNSPRMLKPQKPFEFNDGISGKTKEALKKLGKSFFGKNKKEK